MQISFSRKITRKFFYFLAFCLIISFLTGGALFPVQSVSNNTSGTNSSQTSSENPSSSSANTGFQSAAPNAILMEATTGTILYEKDADKEKPPASVTKIMTLLLIFEALSKKQITLNDTVTVSEHAASMGGSQVFLEPGETQTVDTMIKCIAVSSANDACVAYSHSRN